MNPYDYKRAHMAHGDMPLNHDSPWLLNWHCS